MKTTQDDLITPTPQEPIIIQQSGGSDKKFIYTLLILLVILFIIALGVIVFLSSKFFSTQAPRQVTTIQNTPAKTITQNEKMALQKALQQQAVNKQESTNASSHTTQTGALEALVKQNKTAAPAKKEVTQTQQIIAKTAQATGKTLTQEDIQKIAALVAAQLAKTQQSKAKQVTPQTASKAPATTQEEQNLIASLESASVDTLQEQEISTNNVESNIQAKQAPKKVDTFNKVIVQNNKSSEDEFSKLTKEIDSILQSSETSQNSETISALKKEATTHAKEIRFIVVKRGDTLSSIAQRAYGRASAYVKIYKANPELIKNPNRIYVGMKLRVPVDEEYKGQ